MADTVIQQIKDRLDIVEVVSGYLKLEKTGINLRANCPFHGEKTPSFFVSPTRQMFKCFGCFVPGSLIKTEKGFHKIEELEAGQMVLTHKGRFQPITRTLWRPYNGKVLNIRIRKSNEVTSLTEDHEVFAIKANHCKFKTRPTRICQQGCLTACSTKFFKDYYIQKIKASELSVDDYLLYPINKEVCDVKTIDLEKYSTWKKGIYGFYPRYFSTDIKVDNDFLRFIGYYIAEGSNNRAFIRFSLGNQEIDFAEEIRDLAKKLFGFNTGIHIRDKNKKGRSGIEVSICNSKLSNIFANLLGKGAGNKHIPFELQCLPIEKQKVILEAIFKGDGCYIKSKNEKDEEREMAIKTVSLILMEQIRDILLRMNIIPNIFISEEMKDKNNVHHQKVFAIRWQKNYSLNYSNFYYDKENNVHYWASPIREIEKRDYKGNVFNLTVANDHSYVASNFVVGNCGESGSVFDFVMKMEGIEFGDALRTLARRAGVQLPNYHPEIQTKRNQLYEILELAARFFEKQLHSSQAGQLVLKYLTARGLTAESIKKWRLGYSPDQWRCLSDFLVGQNYQRDEIVEAGLAVVSGKGKPPYDRFRGRIIFPVFDANGQVIGFGGRVFGEKPKDIAGHETGGAKYINTPATLLYDKSRVLYGLHLAKTEIRRVDQCVLTEGYTDVILAHQAGFVNTISTSGTALTNQHLQIIKRYTNNLLMAFDADAGGDAATTRGIDLALAEEFNVKVIAMPQGLDPADVISQDATKWAQCLEQAKDIIAFYFSTALHRFDKSSAEGKKQIAQMVLPVLKKIGNAIVRSHWLGQLSLLLNISEDVLAGEMAKIKINPVISHSQSAGSTRSEIGEKPSKLRREILQERLVGLLLVCPEGLDFVEKIHFDFFTIPSAYEVIIALKTNPVNSPEAAWAICQKLSQEKKEMAEFLSQTMFWAEESQSAEDLFAEIQLCLEQLKGLSARKNLQTLGAAIRQAETTSDETQLADLMRQFSQISKEII